MPLASRTERRLVYSKLAAAEISVSSRARNIFEIVAAYGLILAVIWTPGPLQRVLYWAAIATVLVTTLLRRENLNALGLGIRGFASSLWIAGLAAVLAAVTVWGASLMQTLHPLFGQEPLLAHAWGYFVWALMQQFLLQAYFLPRFLRLTSSRWLAVAAVALLFAVAHIPNPILTIAAFAWGGCSSLLFLRYRNLYTLGIAHGILGICFAVTVPDHFHHHMRVGLGYLRYHQHISARPHS